MDVRTALLIGITFLCALGATDTPAAAPLQGVAPGGATPAPSMLNAPLGDHLFAAADFGGAERAYRSTLRDDPHNAAAQLGLARIALYRNDLDEADIHAHALAADDLADPHARRLLANIAERRDDGPNYRVTMAGAEIDVRFEQMDPLPQLDGVVNGKPAHLLLDTGGEGLDLTTAFAKVLGLATKAAGEGVFAGGLRGTVRMGHVNRLELGGASIRSIPISVVNKLPPGIDGVLGTNVLYRFLSTIDYPNRMLVLRPKSASRRFEADASARGAVILPMLLVPDHFIFTQARVNDAPQALFNVDTGGAGIGVQLTRAELDAAAIVPDAGRSASFGGGGGATRTLPFTADVTLGRRTFPNVPGLYFPDGDQYGIFPFAVAGTISQELFKRGALTFDFSAMSLVFDADGDHSRPGASTP